MALGVARQKLYQKVITEKDDGRSRVLCVQIHGDAVSHPYILLYRLFQVKLTHLINAICRVL